MKELKQRHSGKYLCSVIEECMKDFDCKLIQIISLTTDNGSNMKTLLKNLNDNLSKKAIDNESECSGEASTSTKRKRNEMELEEDTITEQSNGTNRNEYGNYDIEIAQILNDIDKNDDAKIDRLLYDDTDDLEND